MARLIPEADRRLAEEAVRRGLVAAVVMEDAAKQWSEVEDSETFPAFLVRRVVLTAQQIEDLAEALQAPEPDTAVGAVPAEGDKAARSPSEVIPGFRILERLGRGGMGSVYRAEQTGMKRTVALKILRRPLARDQQQVERLRREARLVGSLNHPNIVRGLDVGQHGPYHYFVMEFVEGNTLRDRLKRRGAMPEAEVLRILRQVVEALEHAHSRGVIHRDVKPGNIMLTPEGMPKLTDYGLAKGPADFTLTQSGVTIGTPQYISPEQARDPAGVDIQTDLYSLGATAYHMLTGVPPHTSETLAGLLTKVLYEKPRTARQVNSRVSPGASFLVEKLMAKQRKHRYREPRDVLRDLRALESGRSIVPRNWAGDFEVHAERSKFRRVAMAAVALFVVGVASLAWMQHAREQENIRFRETTSLRELDDLRSRARPGSLVEWQAYIDDLERLQQKYPDTTLRERVPEEIMEAEKYVALQKQAQRLRPLVLAEKNAGKFRKAIELLRSWEEPFEKGGIYGARPLQDLRELRTSVEDDGVRAADRRVARAIDQAEAMERKPGAVDLVERILMEARKEILDDMVLVPTVGPVTRLDEVIATLRRARGVLRDAHMARYLAEKDELLREGAYGRLMSILDAAHKRIGDDDDLQVMFSDMPDPAGWDLRSIPLREAEALRNANETANERVLVQARALALDGNDDAALELIDTAMSNSLDDMDSELRELAESINAERTRREQVAESRVRGMLATLLDDLGRRDFFQARRRLDDPKVVENEEPGSPLLQARDQGLRLIATLDELAYSALRRRVRAGVDFEKGLRFGPGQPHSRVWNVRMKQSTSGDDILVFDAPGQNGLEGYLHEVSLELLLHYSGLEVPTRAEQSLCNAALQIVEGGMLSRNALERARSHLLRAAEGDLDMDLVIGALLDRSRRLIDERMLEEKDKESTALKTFEEAKQLNRDGRPSDAKSKLDDLTTSTLATTEFVRNRGDAIEEQRALADRLLEEMRIEGLYPGAIVTEGERTRVEWSFSSRRELHGFQPPDDQKARLYRVTPDGPDGVGDEPPLDLDQPFEGHLQFVRAAPGDGQGERRWLSDSPLIIQTPLRVAKYAAVSFTYRSDDPLYLQVSLWGNHLGVLTDDGRRMSGRGVHGWQSQDWGNPDSQFPDYHRHDYIERNPAKLEENPGGRYFQFEKGVSYRVKVEWDRGRMTLEVDGRRVWTEDLGSRHHRTIPQQVRISTWTPGRIDNLVLEGEIDKSLLKKLLKKR